MKSAQTDNHRLGISAEMAIGKRTMAKKISPNVFPIGGSYATRHAQPNIPTRNIHGNVH
jgi:hypothetical protein